MNFTFLANLAKKNPALARLINLCILSGIVYGVGALAAGEMFSVQAMMQAVLVPLLGYLDKVKRDLNK